MSHRRKREGDIPCGGCRLSHGFRGSLLGWRAPTADRPVKPTLVKLANPIQHYAWGSRSAIARLQGRSSPTPDPEAELWIGDHPVAPSSVVEGGALVALPDWIARDLSQAPQEAIEW